MVSRKKRKLKFIRFRNAVSRGIDVSTKFSNQFLEAYEESVVDQAIQKIIQDVGKRAKCKVNGKEGMWGEIDDDIVKNLKTFRIRIFRVW